MYLLNGESTSQIDFLDRGFQYGDGLFETIEVLDGTPVFLSQHLQRLSNGCERLLIPFPALELLEKEAFQIAHQSDASQVVLKLIVTRGVGGRGYRQPETIQATRLFSLHPFPDYPAHFKQQGIVARFCRTRLSRNPLLAGIKHLNRLEQVLARAEWNSSAIQEGVMLDDEKHVIEGTMSNIFMVKNNCLITPALSRCGVDGILRNIIIALAKSNNINVLEQVVEQQALYLADEVFVSNSIIGIWPIKKINDQSYKIGALTQQLQALLLAFKQKQMDDA